MFKFRNKLFKKNSNIEIKEITSNILEIKNRVYNTLYILKSVIVIIVTKINMV